MLQWEYKIMEENQSIKNILTLYGTRIKNEREKTELESLDPLKLSVAENEVLH
jgi:hypothetical protein